MVYFTNFLFILNYTFFINLQITVNLLVNHTVGYRNCQFEITVLKVCTYSHVKLEVTRIKVPRDRVSVGLLRLSKVGFRWFADGFLRFSLNIELNFVKYSKKMYFPFMSH